MIRNLVFLWAYICVCFKELCGGTAKPSSKTKKAIPEVTNCEHEAIPGFYTEYCHKCGELLKE